VAKWLTRYTVKNTSWEHPERAGIVHRLDRATSGVMICAKTPEALKWLQKQFAERKVKKEYLVIINGTINPKEAIIDMPIARNPRNPKTFHVSVDGKPAKTQYSTISSQNNQTLLRLLPETGRTHQLRVHLSHQGHPIIGDEMYKGDKFERLLLHAHNLKITLPSKTHKNFTAPIPKQFKI
jgi:23S rRNA pseudouridine1911/1915/1917 synthase